MNQLPDRTVIIGILITLGIVFASVFWFVRLTPSTEAPLQWRDSAPQSPNNQPLQPQRALPGTTGGALI
jgi:hypothetical protein